MRSPASPRTARVGVYRLVAGEPKPGATSAAWLSKPAGRTYPEFLAELGALGSAAWQRQMVLGPTPEFCVHDPIAAGDAGTTAPLVRVA